MARPLKVPLRMLGFNCGLDFSLNPQPFPNTLSLLCVPSSCSRPASQQLLLAPPVATLTDGGRGGELPEFWTRCLGSPEVYQFCFYNQNRGAA